MTTVTTVLSEEDFLAILKMGPKGCVFIGLLFPPGMMWASQACRPLFESHEKATEFQLMCHDHHLHGNN